MAEVQAAEDREILDFHAAAVLVDWQMEVEQDGLIKSLGVVGTGKSGGSRLIHEGFLFGALIFGDHRSLKLDFFTGIFRRIAGRASLSRFRYSFTKQAAVPKQVLHFAYAHHQKLLTGNAQADAIWMFPKMVPQSQGFQY